MASVNGSAFAKADVADARASLSRLLASASLSSAPTWTIQVPALSGGFAFIVDGSDAVASAAAAGAELWGRGLGSAYAIAVAAFGRAGNTPRMPLPVPWSGGCASAGSALATGFGPSRSARSDVARSGWTAA